MKLFCLKNKYSEVFNGFLPDNSLLNDVPTFKLFVTFAIAFVWLVIASVTSEESGLILTVGALKPVKAFVRFELIPIVLCNTLAVNLLSLSFLS